MSATATLLDKTHQYLACTSEQLPATLQAVKRLYAPEDAKWFHSRVDGFTDAYKLERNDDDDDDDAVTGWSHHFYDLILVDDHQMTCVSRNGDEFPPAYTCAKHVIFVTSTIESLQTALPQLDRASKVEVHYALWNVLDACSGHVILA